MFCTQSKNHGVSIIGITSELVRDAESQDRPQNSRVRICNLTRCPGNSYTHQTSRNTSVVGSFIRCVLRPHFKNCRFSQELRSRSSSGLCNTVVWIGSCLNFETKQRKFFLLCLTFSLSTRDNHQYSVLMGTT